MTQIPNNPMQLVPKAPRTPKGVAAAVGSYVMAFVRISLWSVVAVAAGAFVYIAIRGIVWAVGVASGALGVSLFRRQRASTGLVTVRNARNCARCGATVCGAHRRWVEEGWLCIPCAKKWTLISLVRPIFFREEE